MKKNIITYLTIFSKNRYDNSYVKKTRTYINLDFISKSNVLFSKLQNLF